MRVVFVHGACVTDASWWWSRMTSLLTSAGIAAPAVELPSCGDPDGNLGDLHRAAKAVRNARDAGDEPSIVVVHSYSGIVVTDTPLDRRAQEVVEFDAGHHPFLTPPEAVTDLPAQISHR